MYKRARVSKAPVATSTSVQYNAARNTLYLSGREYIDTVVLDKEGGFKRQYGILRPTDNGVFSWLSGIASKFEVFKFVHLNFVYEPQCPTTTSGSVGIFFDGDPTHTPPSDWNSFINTGANVHGAPWAKHQFPVPRHLYSGRREYYTKSEFPNANGKASIQDMLVPQPTDPLEYYPGLYGWVTVDTTNAAGSVECGKFYIEYTVMLKDRNVGGDLVTNLSATAGLSKESASNSGTGMVVRKTGLTLASGSFLFGGSPATNPLTGYIAGDEYFQILSTGQAVARQDLSLNVQVFVNLSGGTGVSLVATVTPATGTGVCTFTCATDCGSTTSGTEVADKFNAVYQTTQQALTWVNASQGMDCFQLNVKQGDLFDIKMNSGASTITQFYVIMTPCVFQLND